MLQVYGQHEQYRLEIVQTLGTPVVWAKFKGFPWWPAQVVELSMRLPVTVGALKRILATWQPGNVLTSFFGSKAEFSWITAVSPNAL